MDWSKQIPSFQLHDQKYKELLIQFHKTRTPFPSVQLNTGCPNLLRHAKILGLTISDDLKWSKYVTEIIKKVNKRIYFIVQLKRAKVSSKEIVNLFGLCVRPILEYASEVFHFALPTYIPQRSNRTSSKKSNINQI
jgi:hypothetical protein